MKFSHIVAMSQNKVIGLNGELPWHISEDLKRFKKITMGHPIMMGRKTFESIGKPLLGRFNIVISKTLKTDLDTKAKNILNDHCLYFAGDLDEAFDLCLSLDGSKWGDESFIIGGGEIYRQSINRIDRIYRNIFTFFS